MLLHRMALHHPEMTTAVKVGVAVPDPLLRQGLTTVGDGSRSNTDAREMLTATEMAVAAAGRIRYAARRPR